MKIAVVGPSPVPFTIGGAENFLWGLCEAINKETEHQAELIKLPSREFEFWDLIQSYYDFYKLNLDQFDLVISSKYPSWMVRHRNCICYMLHTLRGLYDTYNFNHLPDQTDRKNAHVNQILDYMEHHKKMDDLNRFFTLMSELKKKNVPDRYFSFPGAFIREIVHYLDAAALSQDGMKRIVAISETVKKRREYFPANAQVDVIYPPAILKKRKTGDTKYIFVASRLDAPKRFDMLIRAMKYVRGDVSLYIAGTGPQQEEWKKLAAKDSRIHFTGFVDEETLEDYYADSLVVPYFPYDEDYGLITIEAMLHKKPVITTTDAGGPTEFVVDGETGFVVKFQEKAIADKINYFVAHPQEAKRMGENACEKVKNITWKHAVEKLLGQIPSKTVEEHQGHGNVRANNKMQKNRITVVTTFPVYPPKGGGQTRIYYLCKYLAKENEINIISVTNADQKGYEGYISENLKEIRITKTRRHQEAEWDLEKKAGIPAGDIAMMTMSAYTPEYEKKLKESIEQSSLVIISHPYLYDCVNKYLNGRPFIYEAQDVEVLIKEQMLPKSKIKNYLIEKIRKAEKECCERSKMILTCSKEDQIKLGELYCVPVEKMTVIANGTDCNKVPFTSVDERMMHKKSAGLEKNTIGVFMGSWHQPNLEACEKIFEIAKKCPKVIFLLMGSQCEYFRGKKLPDNVGLLGVVSDTVKVNVLKTADFALNPVISGSGTNLKMFDYMAVGLPVITTKFGIRGIDNEDSFIVCDIKDMSDMIFKFSLNQMKEKVKYAREYVEKEFDWEVISRRLRERIYVNDEKD